MKTIQVTVDRIENNIAVLELPDTGFINMPVKYLPENLQEGNVVDMSFQINKEEENKRVQEIKDLQQELLDRNK